MHDNGYVRKRELEDLIRAFELVENSVDTLGAARLELERLNAIQQWLFAEGRWKARIDQWLTAEKKYQLRDLKFDDPVYAAGRRGWEAIKKYVPTLDGVSRFEDLNDSLAFRYAAFAAAVLGELPPAEVKSHKSVAREMAEASSRAAHPAGKGLTYA